MNQYLRKIIKCIKDILSFLILLLFCHELNVKICSFFLPFYLSFSFWFSFTANDENLNQLFTCFSHQFKFVSDRQDISVALFHVDRLFELNYILRIEIWKFYQVRVKMPHKYVVVNLFNIRCDGSFFTHIRPWHNQS